MCVVDVLVLKDVLPMDELVYTVHACLSDLNSNPSSVELFAVRCPPCHSDL